MWEQSVFSVQMAGKRSKEFGADELEAWPSQFLVPKGFVAAKLAEIAHFPAQFLHGQKLPHYLQSKQSDTKVLSPAQDDSSEATGFFEAGEQFWTALPFRER